MTTTTTTNGEQPKKDGGELGLIFSIATIVVVIYIAYTLLTA